MATLSMKRLVGPDRSLLIWNGVLTSYNLNLSQGAFCDVCTNTSHLQPLILKPRGSMISNFNFYSSHTFWKALQNLGPCALNQALPTPGKHPFPSPAQVGFPSFVYSNKGYKPTLLLHDMLSRL